MIHEKPGSWFIEIVLKGSSVTVDRKGWLKRNVKDQNYQESNGINIAKEDLKYYKPSITLLKSFMVKSGIGEVEAVDAVLTPKILSLSKMYRAGKISFKEYETTKTRILEKKWY